MLNGSTTNDNSKSSGDDTVLSQILASLKSLQQENASLAATVDAINGRVNVLSGVKQAQDGTAIDGSRSKERQEPTRQAPPRSPELLPTAIAATIPLESSSVSPPPDARRRTSLTSKIILTSYPGQAGVDPLPMNWGAKDPNVRGPITVSRNPNTIRRRNGRLSPWSSLGMLLMTAPSDRSSWRLVRHLPCLGCR